MALSSTPRLVVDEAATRAPAPTSPSGAAGESTPKDAAAGPACPRQGGGVRHGHLSRGRRHRRHFHRHRAARLRRRGAHQEDFLQRQTYARAIVDGLAELFAETGVGAWRHRGDPPTAPRSPPTPSSEQKGAPRRPDHHQGVPRRPGDPKPYAMPALYDNGLGPTRRHGQSAICGRWCDERIDHNGRIERASTPPMPSVRWCAAGRRKVEAIAVCLLNSFRQSAHELMLRDIVRRRAPGLPLSVPTEVLPEIKEYERTSTTVINAYVMPIVATLSCHAPAASMRRSRPGLLLIAIERRAHDRTRLPPSGHEHQSNRAPARRRHRAPRRWRFRPVLGKSSLTTWAARQPRGRRWSRTARSCARTNMRGAGIMVGSRLLTRRLTLKSTGHRPGRGPGTGGARLCALTPAAPCRLGRRAPAPPLGRVLYDAAARWRPVTDASRSSVS